MSERCLESAWQEGEGATGQLQLGYHSGGCGEGGNCAREHIRAKKAGWKGYYYNLTSERASIGSCGGGQSQPASQMGGEATAGKVKK